MNTKVQICQLIDSNFHEKCLANIEENINLEKTLNIEELKNEIEQELEIYVSHVIEKVVQNNREIDIEKLTQLVVSVCEEKYQYIVEKLLKDRGLYKTSDNIILAPLETPKKIDNKITVSVEEENEESAFIPSNEGTDIDSVLNSFTSLVGNDSAKNDEILQNNIIIPTKDVGNVTFNGFDL